MKTILTLILLILATPSSLPADTALAPRSGVLLVASEQIDDPRFQESVILIVRHDQKGTSGLILNRPLGKLPAELEGTLFTPPNGLYWGGPVSPLQVSALLFTPESPGGMTLQPGMHLLDRERIDELFRKKALKGGELRIYLGYAGWAPRQLARELERGDWSIHPADPATLQEKRPDQLWPSLVPVKPSPWI